MLTTEFVRSLNHNYERMLLNQKPEDRIYQYCILGSGGIKGLLPCSLRYIDGLSYLYYDITSRQSLAQLYQRRCLSRRWIQDFVWGIGQLQQELERFLLDYCNVLWQPEQIFQELERNVFSFIYVPYYDGENHFIKLLDFWIERIDYEDEGLVECVYKMYERFEQCGDTYLQAQIFEDVKSLEKKDPGRVSEIPVRDEENKEKERKEKDKKNAADENVAKDREYEDSRGKRGFFNFLEGKKRKNKETRNLYRQEMERTINGYAVAEENTYDEEELGKTIYIEESGESMEKIHGLYTAEGKLLVRLDKNILSIGKMKSESDLVLEDHAVSRMHARILKEPEGIFLEDMNSTNGTFKNGLRMQPYEKKRLEEEDEIKLGKTILFFR